MTTSAFGYADYENILWNEDPADYDFEIFYDQEQGAITLNVDLYKPADDEEWNVDEWEKRMVSLSITWNPGYAKSAAKTASRIARSFITGKKFVQVGDVLVKLNDLSVMS